MGLTTDPSDPTLTRGVDDKPVEQADTYLVLSKEEIAQGFVRPVRMTYIHEECGTSTTMNIIIAETYAARPSFYGATYCAHCKMHKPVGANGEFIWEDGTKVGT